MLKVLHHKTDPQSQITDAGVMTTSIVAALDYGDNLEKVRQMLQAEGYIPTCWGKVASIVAGIAMQICS
jgi:hypothetical protein